MQSQRPVPYGTPRQVRCIVKLGGSAITVKQQHETLKAEVLSSVCSTLKQLYDTLQQQDSQPGMNLMSTFDPLVSIISQYQGCCTVMLSCIYPGSSD